MAISQLKNRSVGRVRIADTTLRDENLVARKPGLSMGGEHDEYWRSDALSMAERIELALRLAELGVDVIEAGFGDTVDHTPALAALAARFGSGGPVVSGLVSAHSTRERLSATAEAVSCAGRPRVHVYVKTSDIADEEGRFRRNPTLLLDEAMGAVEWARGLVDEVEFSPPQVIVPGAELAAEWAQAAIEAGARIVNIRTTAGSANPEGFLALLAEVARSLPSGQGVLLSADPFVPDRRGEIALEAATRCAEVAIEAGCRQVKCAMHGIAGTPGHPSLELLAFRAWLRQQLRESHLWTGIDPTKLVPASEAVAAARGFEIPASQPLVGSDTTSPCQSEFPDDPVERALLATAKRIVLQGLGIPVPQWLDEFAAGTST